MGAARVKPRFVSWGTNHLTENFLTAVPAEAFTEASESRRPALRMVLFCHRLCGGHVVKSVPHAHHYHVFPRDRWWLVRLRKPWPASAVPGARALGRFAAAMIGSHRFGLRQGSVEVIFLGRRIGDLAHGFDIMPLAGIDR